jgi:hypothetical protein
LTLGSQSFSAWARQRAALCRHSACFASLSSTAFDLTFGSDVISV